MTTFLPPMAEKTRDFNKCQMLISPVFRGGCGFQLTEALERSSFALTPTK